MSTPQYLREYVDREQMRRLREAHTPIQAKPFHWTDAITFLALASAFGIGAWALYKLLEITITVISGGT